MSMSLWLVPNEKNPFTKTVQELISDTVPRNFLSPHEINDFTPHVTVTPDINTEKLPGGKQPQEWLDSLEFPDFKREFNEVIVELDHVEADDSFYSKMNITVNDNANLQKLVAICRSGADLGSQEKAQAWAEHEYQPHLSLLYADVSTKEVKNKVPLIEMKIQFAIGDLFACCGGTLCMGGWLVLVDTSKPIDEWKKYVAKREVDWVMWRATKNLI